MAIRDTKPIDRDARLARLEAENARLRRLAAELADELAAHGYADLDDAYAAAHTESLSRVAT